MRIYPLLIVAFFNATSVHGGDSLNTLNNRLALLYKAKGEYENKLFNCELNYKEEEEREKKCHSLRSKVYFLGDEIEKLEPKIREKELLELVKRGEK